MGKTNRKEPNRSKKAESEAHRLRRTYKDQIEHLLELDEEEMEEVDLDFIVRRRVSMENRTSNGNTD